MNKNKYLIITVIMFCFILTISGTVAYFNYSTSGKINVNTANYTINITSESISNQTINLGNNLKPYDKGSFTINLNLNGTNTEVLTTVSIERTNLPKGFKFLAQNDNISPFSTYSKLFEASSSTKTDSVTVYWYWDGNVDDESDNEFINQVLSANIVVKSKQMNGAMMKNGHISQTEFWSNTYRPYIRTIKFINNLSNLPSSCTGDSDLCWDVSYDSNQDKKVYAYLIDSGLDYTDNDNVKHDLYNLYIASMAQIMAPSDCGGIYYNFINLTSINFNNNFNTYYVTNMYSMFNSCKSLTDIDLSGFNTTNVGNIGAMFQYCSSITSLDLSSFNTSSVIYMHYLFYECLSLTNLDLSSFNTSNVIDMGGMFYYCKSLTSLDLSNFNTSNVINMRYMFYLCSSLTNLDLGGFNTSKVTDMMAMFCSCNSLTSLDLSSFNTLNVTAMDYMFAHCSSLTSLDISNFNTSNVNNVWAMFYDCKFLTTTINIMSAGVTNYDLMFNGAATNDGAKITVNYIADASTLVDNMIATKSSNSNVVKGNQL